MLTPKPTTGDTTWFVRDRFGMFIHWGLYALPARHEWVLLWKKSTRRLTRLVTCRALTPHCMIPASGRVPLAKLG